VGTKLKTRDDRGSDLLFAAFMERLPQHFRVRIEPEGSIVSVYVGVRDDAWLRVGYGNSLRGALRRALNWAEEDADGS
jgi:hypothetical protein